MAERFETQSSLLEYLNKNTNDRSLIQRMIKRGEVYKEEGAYYLVKGGEEGGEKKSESKTKNKKPEEGIISNEELKELKRKNEELITSYNNVVKKYNHLLDEYNKIKDIADANLYGHLKMFYEKYMIWKDYVEKKVWYYAKQKGVDMEDMREEVYGWYKYSENEDMKNAIEFVGEFIKKRDKEIEEEKDSIPF